MGLKPMILLKMIEILLKFPDVWDRLKKIMEVLNQTDHPLPDLYTVAVDLRKAKWKKATSPPFAVGFLNVRQTDCFSPSGSRLSFLPSRVLRNP